MRRTAITFVALAAVMLHAVSSRASEGPEPQLSAEGKKQCVDDYVAGQRTRNARNFVAARKHFLACGQTQCHVNVRKDCTVWLSELAQAAPSVVIVAQHKGIDVTSVRLYLDGDLLVDGLDGRAIEVNPGKHTLRFESDGYETSEQALLIREGERNRSVVVSLRKPGESFGGGKAEGVRSRRDVPALSYILGGVGLAGVGLFAGFGLKGMAGKSDLDKLGCKPNCDSSKTASIKRDFVIGDVSLAIGIASLTTAAVLLFTRGYEEPKASNVGTKVRVDFAPVTGGGAAVVSGNF